MLFAPHIRFLPRAKSRRGDLCQGGQEGFFLKPPFLAVPIWREALLAAREKEGAENRFTLTLTLTLCQERSR